MLDDESKGAFDELVAGLSSIDRKSMLAQINKSISPSVQLVDSEKEVVNKNDTLLIKFKDESVFYKFWLWLRSLLSKKNSENLYNDDLIARIAKNINHEHPGLLNHHAFLLENVFYQRLISLRDSEDFFRTYCGFITNNPGDFYVFLSSFISPELVDLINTKADPFILSFDEDTNIEKRNSLMKNLDEILNNLSGVTKEKLYDAITSVNWLKRFSNISFVHFVSQFTNLVGNSYTCPYKNAINDYDILATVFETVESVSNEVLEAIFLYSKKKDLEGNNNIQDKDVERALKEFLAKANSNLANVQMFITGVPIIKLGKVINNNYDWTPEINPGIEAWFPSFRQQWRKIIDIRWNDWIRARKKHMLSSNLQTDFFLSEFPVLKYTPWTKMWIRVPFSCELTGGFLSWFATEKYDEVISVMNDVIMEGVFLRSDNRSEYSDALNMFVQANKQMQELLDRLSSEGDYGAKFEEFSNSKLRTIQIQNQIDSMMAAIESTIHDCVSKFSKSCRIIDFVYRGFFSEYKDGIHEGLQNWMSIKGHQNRIWRDNLSMVHTILRKSLFYISELEPIDASTTDN